MEGKSGHRKLPELSERQTSAKRPRLEPLTLGEMAAKRPRLEKPASRETVGRRPRRPALYSFPRRLREFQPGEMREAWGSMMRQSEQYYIRWTWNLLDLSESERHTLAQVARRYHLLPDVPFEHVSSVILGPAEDERVHVNVSFATDLTARQRELDFKQAFALFRLLSMLREPTVLFDDELGLPEILDGEWSAFEILPME